MPSRQERRIQRQERAIVRHHQDVESTRWCYVVTYLAFEGAQILGALVAALTWKSVCVFMIIPAFIGVFGAFQVMGHFFDAARYKRFGMLVTLAGGMGVAGVVAIGWWSYDIMWPSRVDEKDPMGIAREFSSGYIIFYLILNACGVIARFLMRQAATDLYRELAADDISSAILSPTERDALELTSHAPNTAQHHPQQQQPLMSPPAQQTSAWQPQPQQQQQVWQPQGQPQQVQQLQYAPQQYSSYQPQQGQQWQPQAQAGSGTWV